MYNEKKAEREHEMEKLIERLKNAVYDWARDGATETEILDAMYELNYYVHENIHFGK